VDIEAPKLSPWRRSGTDRHVMADAVSALSRAKITIARPSRPASTRLRRAPAVHRGDLPRSGRDAEDRRRRLQVERVEIVRGGTRDVSRMNETYKLRTSRDPEGRRSRLSLRRFVICAAPHVESTGKISLQLLSVAGAYCGATSGNPMLQRITARRSSRRRPRRAPAALEEAKKARPPRIGRISISSRSRRTLRRPGPSAPKGARIRYLIEQFWVRSTTRTGRPRVDAARAPGPVEHLGHTGSTRQHVRRPGHRGQKYLVCR